MGPGDADVRRPSWTYTRTGAGRLLGGLVAVEIGLIVVYVCTRLVVPSWGVLGSLFNVGLDQSLPSWFSAVQLAALGGAFLLAASANQADSGLPTALLVVMAALGLFLSADEGAGIHERITTAMSDADLDWLLFEGGHGGWVAVYAVLGVLAAVVAFRWLRLLWSTVRREAVLGAIGLAVYLTGAVVVEVLGYETESGATGALDVARIAVEELMEMAGASLLLYAALLLALHVGSTASTANAA